MKRWIRVVFDTFTVNNGNDTLKNTSTNDVPIKNVSKKTESLELYVVTTRIPHEVRHTVILKKIELIARSNFCTNCARCVCRHTTSRVARGGPRAPSEPISNTDFL